MGYLSTKYKDIEVVWSPELDGGGSWTAKEFNEIVRNITGKVDRICEFCAGPSFIGFSLLAEGLCDSLCLIDINPEAVKVIKETIRINKLEDKVSVYLSDGLTNVPYSEKWDLVVSNPPHFCAGSEEEYKQNIILKDYKWSIHQSFFSDINNHLKPHSSVIFQECYMGCEEKIFLSFLKAGHLERIGSFMFKKKDPQWRDVYYYIWAKRIPSEFLWQNEPIDTISINTSELYNKMINMKIYGWKKYRFEIFNDLKSKKSVSLLNGKDKIGRDIKVFSLGNISEDSQKQSNIFYLTPGFYSIIDQDTKELLSKIEVVELLEK